MVGYIYLLSCEPNSDKYYIGVTTRTLKKRMSEHLGHTERKDKRANWINSLKNKGLIPIMEEIDFVETDNLVDMANELDRLETFYIALFKSWGIELLNSGDGGRHNLNVSKETREKMSISRMGHFVSDATKEKLSIKRAGRNFRTGGVYKPVSKETKKKISDTLKSKGIKPIIRFDFTGKRSLTKSKKIIDTSSGKIYIGIKSVLDEYPFLCSYIKLSRMLRGYTKNKTSFRYVEDAIKEKQYNKKVA